MGTPVYFSQGASQSATTGTLTVPWGTHQADDIALLFIETQGGGFTSLSTAAGFAKIGTQYSTGSSGTGTMLDVYWCRATSSAMTSPVVTAGADHLFGVILVYRGCKKFGSPYVGYYSSSSDESGGTKATASTTASIPSITTVNDNALIVLSITKDLDSAAAFLTSMTNASLSSITERFDLGTTSGNGGGIAVSDGLKATAGVVGTTTATVTSSINAFKIIALYGVVPTTVLNTVDGANFATDTTPTLEATATDADGDDVRYQFIIENSFERYGIDNLETVGQLGNAGVIARGQSFTAPSNITLGAAMFFLAKTGSPTGNATAVLYAHTGTYGSSGLPTGTALATSGVFDVSTLTTYLEPIVFTFTGGNLYTLTSGINYVITIEKAIGDSSNYVRVAENNSLTHSGNGVIKNGTTWSDSFTDTIFYVLPATNTALFKKSNTDAGFINTVNGADTDPFTSGQKVSFTVQNADALIAGGTFRYTARALDPLGTNTYGAAPTARTFTVDSPASTIKRLGLLGVG